MKGYCAKCDTDKEVEALEQAVSSLSNIVPKYLIVSRAGMRFILLK